MSPNAKYIKKDKGVAGITPPLTTPVAIAPSAETADQGASIANAPTHTPAPWTFHDKLSASENHRGYVVRDAEGAYVAEVSPRDAEGIDGRRNATLITASHDLLRAAHQALDDMRWTETNVPGSNFQSSIILLRAAIKKATKQ